ncbi:MAG: hypothetical protein ABSG98_10930 [Anaerolineales bacterium]|jgi:hypothetical protein
MVLWVIKVVLGVALILSGRQLFWLFVAGTGFVVALTLAAQTLAYLPPAEIVLIGLAAGLVGAVLALLVQKVAIAVAGFLASGYVILGLAAMAGMVQIQYDWLVFLVGGILGMLLVLSVFEWALIILSSLTGAILIVQTIGISSLTGYLLVLVATLVGIFIQAGALTEEAHRAKDKDK